MNERTQALAQAKLNIFEEILNAKGKYSTFSAIDKLQFVERAFNNVNDYYSHILFGLDPNNTKFGFMLGRNSLATTFTRERAIGYNLRTALLEKNPMRVYEVMFHEFRHVWQDNASLYKQEIPIPRVLNTRHLPKPIAKVLDTALKPARAFTTAVLKPFRAIGNACLYTGKNAKYTYARHEASPNEIDADFSAFQNMASVFREGKVNSSTPVRAERLLHQNTRAWVENMKGHALGPHLASHRRNWQ